VVIEALDVWSIQHNSPSDVMIRLISCGLVPKSTMPCYSNTGTGDVFIESVNFGGNLAEASHAVGMHFGPTHQNVWARALDIEGWFNHVYSEGATVWVFGLKFGETEGEPCVTTPFAGHTHTTHTHTHTPQCTRTQHTHAPQCAHTHLNAHTHTHTHTHSHIHTLTHSLAHSLTHKRALARSRNPSHACQVFAGRGWRC
jgi:hypothetical protein